MTSATDVEGAAAPRRAPRLRWWREVAYILAFYGLYTLVRNKGLHAGGQIQAFHNAQRVISVEKALWLFHEHRVQQTFLSWRAFIGFWNVFYGTAHFIVTVFALVYMFRRMPARYPLWRNTLAATTALALIGFAFFPLMPPRLLHTIPGTHYGFVDTLDVVKVFWSFDSGTMQKISNQYAAMPSLHFGWSSWCALVLAPAIRHRWGRALMYAYPFLTLFAIVVTANHFILDAVGGAVVLGVGFLIGRVVTEHVSLRTPKGVPAET